MNEQQFKNKTVLITGGVQGIGFECVKKFQSFGSKVIVTCKSQASYDFFEKNSLKENIQLEKLDLTNEISIDILHQKIDKLDILINNATLFKGGIEYRIENFSDVVNVNLMGLMRICHTFLPKLALSGGNIINIGSIFTKSTFEFSYSYLIFPTDETKACILISFKRSLAIAPATTLTTVSLAELLPPPL